MRKHIGFLIFMLDKNTVNNILKLARQKKHLSQAEVARYSSLTQSDLSKFENGKKDILLSTLLRIATTLDMIIIPLPKEKLADIEQLFTEDQISIIKPKTLLDKYGIPDDER